MKIYALRSKEKDASARKVTFEQSARSDIIFGPRIGVTAKRLADLGLCKDPSVDYIVNILIHIIQQVCTRKYIKKK